MTRIGFLLLDGFSNMVLSCLLEPLRAVRDQAQPDISWQILTTGGAPVRSSSGLGITPDCDAGGNFDMLFVVAGYGYATHARGATLREVAAVARRSRTIIGADTGAWLLAAAGLLDDQRATLHWSLLADFAEAFPKVQVTQDSHVGQGRIWTCGGAAGALDLVLALISERFGPADAFIASSMFLNDTDRQQTRLGQQVGKGTPRLRQVVSLMAGTLENPLPLSVIANRCGLSPSKLDRLFRAELNLSPGRYYQMLRLSKARELAAATDDGLRDIAIRCGYADAPALCKAYRRVYGHPIRQAPVGQGFPG